MYIIILRPLPYLRKEMTPKLAVKSLLIPIYKQAYFYNTNSLLKSMYQVFYRPYHEYHVKHLSNRNLIARPRSFKLFPTTNICDERDSPFLLPSTTFPNLSTEIQNASSREIHTGVWDLSENASGNEKGKDVKIKYSIVPREQSLTIARFLYNHYHQNEPITMALGMDLAEVDGWFKRFLRMYMFVSVIDVSVEAIDGKAKKRVGVFSSVVIDPSRTWPVFESFIKDRQTHPVNVEMNEFYEQLEKGVDPKYLKGENGKPVYPKIHEHMFICVHPQYQSLGISGHMVRLSQSLAQNINGCRIGYVICTSEYSYRLYKRHGFEVVNEISYKDYVNSKGVKIFEGKEHLLGPHTKCRAMTKKYEDLYSG